MPLITISIFCGIPLPQNCIDSGMDVKCLSEILGHSNVQITLNKYVHPSMDTKRKYINALSADYGQLCGQT